MLVRTLNVKEEKLGTLGGGLLADRKSRFLVLFLLFAGSFQAIRFCQLTLSMTHSVFLPRFGHGKEENTFEQYMNRKKLSIIVTCTPSACHVCMPARISEIPCETRTTLVTHGDSQVQDAEPKPDELQDECTIQTTFTPKHIQLTVSHFNITTPCSPRPSTSYFNTMLLTINNFFPLTLTRSTVSSY